jgi:hypothetical protein
MKTFKITACENPTDDNEKGGRYPNDASLLLPLFNKLIRYRVPRIKSHSKGSLSLHAMSYEWFKA